MPGTYLHNRNNPDMPEVVIHGAVRTVQEMRQSVTVSAFRYRMTHTALRYRI